MFYENLARFGPLNSDNARLILRHLENGPSQIGHIVGIFLGFPGTLAKKSTGIVFSAFINKRSSILFSI